MPPLRQRKTGDTVAEDSSDPSENNQNGVSNGQQAHKTTANPKPTLAPAPTPAPLLDTVCSFSAKTFTTDQGLKIIQWSSWAISYLTASSKHHKETLSPALRKLYNEVSFTRYVLRFYGLFQSLEGFRSGSWAGGSWDNPKIAKIAKYLMAGSMIFYYPLEHVAYAGWQLPTLSKFSRDNANKISALSCVFWSVYIIGDFWASCLKWKELKKQLNDLGRLLAVKKRDDDKTGMMEVEQEQHALAKRIRLVKLQVIRCLLFILPSVNWSLPNWATNPLLGELPLNGLMLAEAYTSVYQSLVGMRD
eukprot:scaffold716_cov139-Skeletonema_menzelii.AAC.4